MQVICQEVEHNIKSDIIHLRNKVNEIDWWGYRYSSSVQYLELLLAENFNTEED